MKNPETQYQKIKVKKTAILEKTILTWMNLPHLIRRKTKIIHLTNKIKFSNNPSNNQ